jgi:methyl-accepting chemotaxis protein
LEKIGDDHDGNLKTRNRTFVVRGTLASETTTMKFRLSVSNAIILFAAVAAIGLAALVFTSGYALNKLRVGGPLYDQLKLGNDLIADILPPPEYVIEAYLEATLALREPETIATRTERLVQLRKDYDERREYWVKSDLAPGLKKLLIDKSDAKTFWSIAQGELLPAVAAKNLSLAEASYKKLQSAYSEHRAVIDQIVKRATDDGAALETTAAGMNANFSLLVWSVSAVVMLVLALGILGIALGVIRPVVRMTSVMKHLADGDLEIEIPSVERRDEIGEMAEAMQVFKTNMIETKRLRAEQSEIEARQAQRRRADMIKLADDFEGAVGEIIETVTSTSTELEASARTLTSTSERSQQLTTMVAAASEEASTNVQSVASATEEMAASVNEISRQVQTSASIANEAVAQARKTNDRVGELAKAAARIGDVVELINTIAGQTNLLALNATIEAARAGEAGRGFAVVASEVKALAEQTAKATGEISQQITGIQNATQESVGAIKEIGDTISRMSEIASTIASAVEEQGAATQEISRNVQQAAQGTQQVSANITDVQRGTSETGSASSQVLSAAQTLSRDSNRLKTEVGKFLNTVRAA